MFSDSFCVDWLADGIDCNVSVKFLKPELSISSLVIIRSGNGPSICDFLILEPVTTTLSRTTAPSSFTEEVPALSDETSSAAATSSTEVSSGETASSTTSSPGLSAKRNVDKRPTLKNVNKF